MSAQAAASQQSASVKDLLASAHQARAQGKSEEAIAFAAEAIRRHEATNEALPKGSHAFIAVLYHERRAFQPMLEWVERGLVKAPKDFDLLNMRGAALRRLGRFDEAIAALKEAGRIDPKNLSPVVNIGNIYLDLRDGENAAPLFARAVRAFPQNAEWQRLLGVSYRYCNDFARAERHFRIAVQFAGKQAQPFADYAVFLEENGRRDEALALFEKAEKQLGPLQPLIETKVALLRRMGRPEAAIACLEQHLAGHPQAAWAEFQLGRALQPIDRPRANTHLRKALALEPANGDYITELCESLDRTRGAQEAQNIAEAYELALRRLALGGNLMKDAKVLRSVLVRSANYAAADTVSSYAELGPFWAKLGQEAALHQMMGQVKTAQERRDLVAYHRLWGQGVAAVAARTPLLPAPAPVGRAKIRIGIMSSDLRHHPVAYFAAPLLLAYDRAKFEIHCYSWNTNAPDSIQQLLASSVDVFRQHAHISNRDAAQLIADDQCDVLFELGGSTDMNKIRTMAWRPARRQASWLGYPHSCGLEAIDRILTDPFITPQDPALLIEKPHQLARTWVALEKPGLGAIPDIDPVPPVEKNGFVTFGTMNNPYKYNPQALEIWADVLNAVPHSRFVFVRPEGAVASFRANIIAAFAAKGIDPDRILFTPVRGAHLVHYNGIDVALDTFPQTGGTTTCETLWMGVPCITLVGEGFFERLSYSNLNNAGLPQLCAGNLAQYTAKAVETANDVAFRAELRRTMRDRLRANPLGRPDWFVRDFQEAVLAWMDEGA